MMIQFLTGFWDYVVVFLAIITIVVFVHEMGHFLVARWNGVKVETFSIGFGPELFGYTAKTGTRWKVCALPLGGYVKMFGDADPSGAAPTEDKIDPAERAVAFRHKSVLRRASIVFAGPAANFIFAIVLMTGMFMIYGQPRINPIVGEVQKGSAADQAGLQQGDKVILANGQKIEFFDDLQRIVQSSLGEPISMTVERVTQAQTQTLTLVTHPQMTGVTDIFGNVHRLPVLGIKSSPEATSIVKFGLFPALGEAIGQTGQMVSTTLTGLGQMLIGARSTDDLGGPLRIAHDVGHAAQLGIGVVISYVVLLSLNLGLINLVPVPMLDGGHLLFYVIEALRGRPLGARAQEYGFRVGLILVFALMILAARNDLAALKVWSFLKGIVS